ncbi:MAG: pyridoxal 5'-phosphate synthase glutaminase subunit PdxT, partial [Eubacterium sp.]|nr:pyridoxal 5'-phosphate synthase glutaminase subunit PdxT [Eubacterium sp.]
AGMILLAEEIANDDKVHLGLLPVKIKRNAYGRQLGSFYTEEEMKGIGKVPMTFIRAPYVEAVKCGTEIMAVVNEKIVAVKYNNMLAMSFHPELDESDKIHKYFVDMIKNNK